MPPLTTKGPLDHYVVQCLNDALTIKRVRDLTGWQAPVVSADGLQVRWGVYASSVPDDLLAKVEQLIGVSEFIDDLPSKSEARSRVEGGFRVALT